MIGRMRPFYQAHWDISKDIKHVWLLFCTHYIAWIFQWILGDEGRGKWWDRQYRVWTPQCAASWMLLLHMQETVLWIARLGLLSSRGGGPRSPGTRLTPPTRQTHTLHEFKINDTSKRTNKRFNNVKGTPGLQSLCLCSMNMSCR